MQYHFDGFRPGDPRVSPEQQISDDRISDTDVLVVGCGPAGLTLAAQLAQFPEIRTRIVDRKPGPLEMGQADGIACRSMEMFEAFGFSEKVAREAYWVNETTFWQPDRNGKITRADRIQDVEDDLSEMPHVILSQARVHDFYLELMANSPRRIVPDYYLRLTDLQRTDNADYPITATFDTPDGIEIARAKYVVGCDGARSTVRQSLGFELKGEAARQLWGVMDVLAVTNFPDIRFKCAIQSARGGSILIIPREGGTMIRMYIELDQLRDDERAADRNVSAEALIERARDILSPYSFEVKQVVWCSAYEIGQRVCDSFDDLGMGNGTDRQPRIFIAGDACHTHSPKAGQGMNVSMADTFNLGWKLAAVLRGQSDPCLLQTYSAERQSKAQELIDFDRDMARLFSSKTKDNKSAKQFQQYFKKHSRYTAGVEARYDPSIIVASPDHQKLANGLKIGMRFHSAPVVRLADAKRVQLGHVLTADGRWRLIGFAPSGDLGEPGGVIANLSDYLKNDANSPVRRYTSDGADSDSVIDFRVVFQAGHHELALEDTPELLRPTRGRLGLVDYEKMFCPDLKHGPDIFDARQINRQNGALVIIRPDQFVAGILPLKRWEDLAAFFEAFMLPC